MKSWLSVSYGSNKRWGGYAAHQKGKLYWRNYLPTEAGNERLGKIVFFDTSAFLTFIGQESGAEEVERYIAEALEGRIDLHASFVSLTEIQYITIQEEGPEIARQRMEDIRILPIRWHQSDEALCSAAATLKAAHRISFADAFVAATALRIEGLLLHKDPEFKAVGHPLQQRMLPPKSGPSY